MASICSRHENGACAYMQPQHSCAYYKNKSFVKQKIEPPYDPTMSFLGIYWEGLCHMTEVLVHPCSLAGNGVSIDVHQPVNDWWKCGTYTKQNNEIYRKTDGRGKYCIKWGSPGPEKQMYIFLSYVDLILFWGGCIFMKYLYWNLLFRWQK